MRACNDNNNIIVQRPETRPGVVSVVAYVWARGGIKTAIKYGSPPPHINQSEINILFIYFFIFFIIIMTRQR